MLAAWLLAAPLSASVPEIDRPVVDVAGVIDAEKEELVAQRLVAHRDATGVQMAVLVVRTTQPLPIEDYAQAVFESWGGGSAERDDGALFVLAIDDRRNRLHLGYGLEPVVSDATAKGMLDDLRPALKAGAYGDAVEEIVEGVVARTSHLRPGETIGALRGDSPWWWVVVALLGLGVGVLWGTLLGRKKRRRARNGRFASRFEALAADRRLHVLAGAIALAQVAIAIAFADGVGYVAAYSLVAWIHFGLGWLSGATPRRFGWTFAVIVALVLGTALLLKLGPRERVGAGDIAGFSAMLAFMTFLFGGLTALCVWAYKAAGGMAYPGGSSARYGGHGSTTSYAPSSTGYGSSSSSTSTSSSSSSYSGGGGSSGGGGASSSW